MHSHVVAQHRYWRAVQQLLKVGEELWLTDDYDLWVQVPGRQLRSPVDRGRVFFCQEGGRDRMVVLVWIVQFLELARGFRERGLKLQNRARLGTRLGGVAAEQLQRAGNVFEVFPTRAGHTPLRIEVDSRDPGGPGPPCARCTAMALLLLLVLTDADVEKHVDVERRQRKGRIDRLAHGLHLIDAGELSVQRVHALRLDVLRSMAVVQKSQSFAGRCPAGWDSEAAFSLMVRRLAYSCSLTSAPMPHQDSVAGIGLRASQPPLAYAKEVHARIDAEIHV